MSELRVSAFNWQRWRGAQILRSPWPWLLIGAILKLYLVANKEIVVAYRPLDDYWQIVAAAQWFWSRPYNLTTLAHLPVYPLFIATFKQTGMPLRIVIELIYIAGAALLSLSLARIGLPLFFRLVAFAAIVFHPYSFAIFDFAFAETLYGCLLVFFVAFFIRVLTAISPAELSWNACGFAVTAALLWYCRDEAILLGGVFALIALVICLLLAAEIAANWPSIHAGGSVAAAVPRAARWLAATQRRYLHLAIALVVAPAAAIALLGALIATANGLTYGLWRKDELAAPNFMRAYSSLQAIRPDRPLRYVPITADMRQKAYTVSPAFRELAPFLDGATENWGAAETRTKIGINGQIAAGWFYWALIGAAAEAGHFKTAPEAESFFGRIADEITAALRDGRLPSRRVLLAYIDPDFSVWLPHLPHSFIKLLGFMLPAAPTETEPAEWGISADVVATFNVVANRRAKALTQSNYVASGWAYSPAGRPLDIRVVDKDGQYPAAMVSSHGRPDIDRLRAFGFHAEWPSSGQPLASFRLEVVLPQGKQIASPPLSSMAVGQIVKLQSGDDPDQQVHIALDQMTDPTPEPAVQTPGTDKAYVIAFALLSILSAGYFLLLVFRRAPWSWPAASALAFVLTIVTAQVLLFAILDASAWGAMEIRHIFAASILAVLCPVLIFALGRRHPSKNIH